ncbi:unnamed protein product [Phytomonas sp. EM1]|nr:unnamed protein product [Phytomonas sp. EM1]|eukprot:CCW64311.1 unnamed protein product [Phytomonas sp. isolate EM1]
MLWIRDAVNAQPALDTVTKQQLMLPASEAFSMFPDNTVLRVFQIDALATQEDILDILRSNLFQVLSIPPLNSFRFAYQEELKLGLDAFIYYFSTWKLGQSVGDRMHNLVMRDEECAKAKGLQSSTYLVPSLAPTRRILVAHAVLTLLLPYVTRKIQRTMLSEGWEREEMSTWKYRLAKAFRYTVIGWSLFSIVNTLRFLISGGYRTPIEYLLSLRMVYGSQRMIRFTNLIYLNQHLWWTTWTSLLSVLNFGSYLRRLLHAVQSVTSSASGGLITGDAVCCVCHSTPTVSQRSNCGHLYCYYCIKSRLLDSESSGSFRCYKCGQAVHSCFPDA